MTLVIEANSHYLEIQKVILDTPSFYINIRAVHLNDLTKDVLDKIFVINLFADEKRILKVLNTKLGLDTPVSHLLLQVLKAMARPAKWNHTNTMVIIIRLCLCYL